MGSPESESHSVTQPALGARWAIPVVGLFFLSLLLFPHETPSPVLDDGWQQILSWSATRDVVFGRDLVFTYGPLGFLFSQIYAPELYTGRMLWEIGEALGLALVFGWHLRRLGSGAERVVFVYIVCVFVAPSSDAQNFAGMLAIALLALHSGRALPVTLAVAALTLFGLAKFSLMILAGALTAGIALTLLAAGRIPGSVAAVCTLPAVTIGVWCLVGQPLAALPIWLTNSLEIASGYAVAMANPGRGGDLWLSIAFALWAAVFTLAAWCRPPRRAEALLRTAVVLGWVFVAWRAGSVRQDDGHLVIFFAPVLLVPLLVRAENPPRWLKPAAWAFASAALLVASTVGSPEFGDVKRMTRARPIREWAKRVADNAGTLVRGGRRAELDAALTASREEHALPLVRRAVGDDALDLFGHSQGIVFVNGLRFALRPTIQTYNAYTPRLQRLDAEWYAGPHAPDWSLLDLTAIDDRWPASEDGLGLDALRAFYEPVLTERDLLLVRRRDDAPSTPTPEIALERSAEFGEIVPIPERRGSLYLTLEVRPSLWSRVRTALWRSPILHFEVEIDGVWERHRILPTAPRFLLAPALLDTADLVDWARGVDVAWPQAFRLIAEEDVPGAFASTYRIQIERDAPDAFASGAAPGLDPILREDAPR